MLPIFAVINWTLAVALIVGWATFMGHLSPQQRAKRAVLTQELGATYFRPAGGYGDRPTRPLEEA